MHVLHTHVFCATCRLYGHVLLCIVIRSGLDELALTDIDTTSGFVQRGSMRSHPEGNGRGGGQREGGWLNRPRWAGGNSQDMQKTMDLVEEI